MTTSTPTRPTTRRARRSTCSRSSTSDSTKVASNPAPAAGGPVTYTLTLTNTDRAPPPERRSPTRSQPACRSCPRRRARAPAAPRGRPSSATSERSPPAAPRWPRSPPTSRLLRRRHDRAEHGNRVGERPDRATGTAELQSDHQPGRSPGERGRPRPDEDRRPHSRAIRHQAEIHDHHHQPRPRHRSHPDRHRRLLHARRDHLGARRQRLLLEHKPITCKLESIAPGSRATIIVFARADSLGNLVNTAVVATPTPLTPTSRTLATATSKITPGPHSRIVLRDSASPPTIPAGERPRSCRSLKPQPMATAQRQGLRPAAGRHEVRGLQPPSHTHRPAGLLEDRDAPGSRLQIRLATRRTAARRHRNPPRRGHRGRDPRRTKTDRPRQRAVLVTPNGLCGSARDLPLQQSVRGPLAVAAC